MLSGFTRSNIHNAQQYIDKHLYALIGFDPCPAVLAAVAKADDEACRLEMLLLQPHYTPAEITDALPNLREAAWHLSFQCNPQIDALHWLNAFRETHMAMEANK
jgi:hypothetical protein